MKKQDININTNTRSSFSGKIGFVLAAAGSAVGLGNIWRFPYLAAKYGGGIFLLVYIVLAVTFGFSLMMAEIAIGRKTGLSAIGAYEKLSKKFKFLGWIASIVPMIIFPYYCVIGGWVSKYLFTFATGNIVMSAEDNFFTSFISSPAEPIFWLALFMMVSAVIVLFGVQKGIENVSKFFMPVLIALSIFVAIYGLCMPGAMDGLLYYIKPDFSHFSITTVLAAMGQLFYSMSLAMGIMITYGSYMKKDIDLEKSVSQIEIFDTGIAFISGLMIVPAVFVFAGGDASQINAGPGLMFQTLPKVFNQMPLGNGIGTLFFLLVLVAALTSAISLMETIVSIFQDKLKLKRKTACWTVLGISFVIAVPSSLGFGLWDSVKIFGMSILDFFDFTSNSIIMPIVALLTCILIGYVVKTKIITDEIKLSSKFRREKLFVVMIKYIAPIFIVLILISSVLDGIGIIKM